LYYGLVYVVFLIALGCALYIVAANGGSRNLALGFGALVDACTIFAVQLYFELQGSTTAEDFPIEFTTDHETKSIRSRQAYLGGYRYLFVEAEASKLLSTAFPPLTRDDAPKITRDAAIISVLSYLIDEQSDWQLNVIVYKTGRGTISTPERLSAPHECTSLSPDQLREKLTRVSVRPFATMLLELKLPICPSIRLGQSASSKG
jgi:hypothetical protein